MIVESSASLVITSTTLTAEQITQHLGIEPSASRNIGDPHGASRLNASGVVVQRTARETFWRLDSGADDVGDSFSSLVALAELLRDKRDNLASLRPACTTVINWGASATASKAGLSFRQRCSLTSAHSGATCTVRLTLMKPKVDRDKFGTFFAGGRLVARIAKHPREAG